MRMALLNSAVPRMPCLSSPWSPHESIMRGVCDAVSMVIPRAAGLPLTERSAVPARGAVCKILIYSGVPEVSH